MATYEDNEICMWATHCNYLNDPTDVFFGDTLIKKYPAFKDIYSNEFVNSSTNKLRAYYIISFSEQLDDLSMWSMYGKNGTGVMLAFDFQETICHPSFVDYLHCCCYEGKGVANLCERIKKRLQQFESDNSIPSEYKEEGPRKLGFLHGYIHAYSRLIKSKAYKHEQEWRILIPLDQYKGKVLFRSRAGMLIPYIEVFFRKRLLKSIWIGPTQNMELSEISLRMFLDQNDLKEVEIHKSKVPYRI